MTIRQLPPPRVFAPTQVLYLDFDGVLHPEDVWSDHGRPYVRTPPGHLVFENAQTLEMLLDPYPELRIVLSTTWQRHFGYRGAIAFLKPSLRSRCIGGTWHRGMGRYWFNATTRGAQVLDDVARRRPGRWLAVDDNKEGWGDFAASHLITTDPIRGLADTQVFQRFDESLRRFAPE